MNSPSLNEHYEVYSHSDHDEILDENHDTDASASDPETNDFVDPNSLTAMEHMEHSPSPPVDDQWEASPNLGDPELGIYKDIGVLTEPKIPKLKIAQ
jgi:hypothetical protein